MSWNSRAVLGIRMHFYKIHDFMLLWNGFKIATTFLAFKEEKKPITKPQKWGFKLWQ